MRTTLRRFHIPRRIIWHTQKFSSRTTMFEHHAIINFLWLLIFVQDFFFSLYIDINFEGIYDVTHVHWTCPFSFYHELLKISLHPRCQLLTINILSKIMCETMRKIPMCLSHSFSISMSYQLWKFCGALNNSTIHVWKFVIITFECFENNKRVTSVERIDWKLLDFSRSFAVSAFI